MSADPGLGRVRQGLGRRSLIFGIRHLATEWHGSATDARGFLARILLRSYSCGMPRGNPSPKLAITVDPNVHERVVNAAAQEGISVSAWMTEAARRALAVRDGLTAVSEWERANGPFTPEEMTAARHRVARELAAPRKRSA